MLRIKPIFAWYDLWIGVFVDRKKCKVYIFPVPCFGIVVCFPKDSPEKKRNGSTESM